MTYPPAPVSVARLLRRPRRLGHNLGPRLRAEARRDVGPGAGGPFFLEPLVNGLDAAHALVPATIAAADFALAMVTFDRRTGSEVVFWGVETANGETSATLALDPSSGEWRRLDDSPHKPTCCGAWA
ncbi:MAG: hypothetical protein ACRDH0_09455 [Actinomycetota bacterium]